MEKDSSERVVDCFEVRGGMSLTRLGVLVVTTVVSCLGVISILGMIVGGFGSGICQKGGL